jgi:hexulose-6-phosphate isomerase
MNPIGIMQGRLVPPVNGAIQAFPAAEWADEFPRAAAAGIAAIEWIYDAPDAETNPVASDDGVRRIADLSAEHGVAVRSMCADYFMAKPLVRVDGQELTRRVEHLQWLLARAAAMSVTRIVVPFVDPSAILDDRDRDQVVDVMREIAPRAGSVELHLETALGPDAFATLLDRIDHPAVRVNYDSGNSASLGYDPDDEFAAYGSRVGSVHIKDRVRGGSTVPLGTGSADLPRVFAQLKRIGYAGDFVLQVARGVTGDEVAWARENRAYVMRLLA